MTRSAAERMVRAFMGPRSARARFVPCAQQSARVDFDTYGHTLARDVTHAGPERRRRVPGAGSMGSVQWDQFRGGVDRAARSADSSASR
ncbi:hypothetical protein GCM10023081_28530 [Arthrobacter ginkgonis]|uniref:Uncharacterized protein n=1 Tax=Arthrobacter ginkgonis TaxID=1630594 RepID=A0ABP7CF75_9MICC